MPDVDNPEEFRCISLCTGYGGLELGIRRVIPALRTVCYVEVEAFACANLVAKIEAGELDAAPIWTDIKTFNGRPFYKRVHIITAGYPCQGESVAGKRQGKADPRWLWPHIERIIETVEPLWFFGENVSGHLTLGFPTVYRSLRLMGYKVEAGLFTAEEVGAPHKRERLFILAYNSNGQGYSADVAKPREKTQLESCDDGRESELENASRTASSNQDGQISGRARQEDVSQGYGKIGSIRLGAASELANPTNNGFSGQQEGSIQKGQFNKIQKQSECGWSGRIKGCRWPSRPGQPQYEWEEPRTVKTYPGPKPTYWEDYKKKIAEAIESQLGRIPNGHTEVVDSIANRVDRLRLLGNGVVPQQAEKAFRELIKLFRI